MPVSKHFPYCLVVSFAGFYPGSLGSTSGVGRQALLCYPPQMANASYCGRSFFWQKSSYRNMIGWGSALQSHPFDSGAWGPSVCSYQQITSLHFYLMTAYQISPFAFSAFYDSQSTNHVSAFLFYDSLSDFTICIFCILWQPITVALFYLEAILWQPIRSRHLNKAGEEEGEGEGEGGRRGKEGEGRKRRKGGKREKKWCEMRVNIDSAARQKLQDT